MGSLDGSLRKKILPANTKAVYAGMGYVDAVKDLAALRDALAKLKSGDAVVLQVQRTDRLTFVAFNLN